MISVFIAAASWLVKLYADADADVYACLFTYLFHYRTDTEVNYANKLLFCTKQWSAAP